MEIRTIAGARVAGKKRIPTPPPLAALVVAHVLQYVSIDRPAFGQIAGCLRGSIPCDLEKACIDGHKFFRLQVLTGVARLNMRTLFCAKHLVADGNLLPTVRFARAKH